MQQTLGNQAVQRLLRAHLMQAKLTVNQPGDEYEQEADRVADAVMRMPDPAVASQRVTPVSSAAGLQRCSCLESSNGGGQCEECQAKSMSLQRSSAGASTTASDMATAPPLVDEVLRSPGQPLDPATRAFFEPRFGYDFSNVRVHTDSKAAHSARTVNALAYTAGNHVVFGRGQYAPSTQLGQHVLAHELTHVLQQRAVGSGGDSTRWSAAGSERIQRKCHPSGIGHQVCPRTDQDHQFVEGSLFEFRINCDDFKDKEEERLVHFVKVLDPASTVEIHGYASVDGPKDFNENLACARALKAHSILSKVMNASRITAVVSHGPTPGPADERRSVVIRSATGPAKPDVEKRPFPTDLQIKTERKGKVPVDSPPSDPQVNVSTSGKRDVIPTLSISKSSPPPPANLVEITAEVDAQVKLFSTGDDPKTATTDPCRRVEVDTKLNMKLKLDGVGVGDRVHLFYHEPTMSLSFAPPPCKTLPEVKWEVDFFNAEIVPKILEFSLKPALTVGEGQFKPGGSAEVELKPWGKAHNFLSHIKLSGEMEVTSEKDATGPGRTTKTEGSLHIGAEF